jgi:hypothetical protein
MKLDIEKSKEAERHDVRVDLIFFLSASRGRRRRRKTRGEKKQKSKTTPT